MSWAKERLPYYNEPYQKIIRAFRVHARHESDGRFVCRSCRLTYPCKVIEPLLSALTYLMDRVQP